MVEVGRFSMKGQPGQYERGALSPDKQYLVTDRFDSLSLDKPYISQIWNVPTGALVRDLEGDKASFSPDGKSVVTCWHGVRFWETRTGRLTVYGDQWQIHACRLSPDGRYIVGMADGSGWIWDTLTGLTTAEFRTGIGPLDPLYSPNGAFLFTTVFEPHAPLQVILRKAPTGELIAVLDKRLQLYVTAAFSPDSSTLLVGDDQSPTISVIEPQTGKTITELPNWGYDPTFSPDGRFVLVRNDKTVREMDINRQAVVKEARVCCHASFSPDGRYILILSNQVTLVDADTWILRASLDGYSDAFFSPDGKMLVTIGQDEAVIWQMK